MGNNSVAAAKDVFYYYCRSEILKCITSQRTHAFSNSSQNTYSKLTKRFAENCKVLSLSEVLTLQFQQYLLQFSPRSEMHSQIIFVQLLPFQVSLLFLAFPSVSRLTYRIFGIDLASIKIFKLEYEYIFSCNHFHNKELRTCC